MYRTVWKNYILYYTRYISTYFKILIVYKIFLDYCFHHKNTYQIPCISKINSKAQTFKQFQLHFFFWIFISVASKKLLMILYHAILTVYNSSLKNFHYTQTPKVHGYYYIFQKSRYIVINSKYLDTLYKGENKNPNVKPLILFRNIIYQIKP